MQARYTLTECLAEFLGEIAIITQEPGSELSGPLHLASLPTPDAQRVCRIRTSTCDCVPFMELGDVEVPADGYRLSRNTPSATLHDMQARRLCVDSEFATYLIERM